MSLSQSSVAKLYASVIDDVISGVREFFQDEGVDEQVLMELKSSWEAKLTASKAVQPREEYLPAPLKQPPVAQKPLSSAPSQHGGGGGGGGGGVGGGVPTDYGANKQVSIQITLPAQAGVPDSQPRAITIQVPASALQGNQLQSVLTGPVITATMAMPPNLAPALLQQHVTAALAGQAASQGIAQQVLHQASNSVSNNNPTSQSNSSFSNQKNGLSQVDGLNDSSDSDDDDADDGEEEDDAADDDDDDLDDDKEDEENEDNDGGAEEEPLNSGDDVSEEDPSDMFETDNVVVCQYDKITRTRNKWKFYLKDGIMNLGGKDFVFQKSNGDAEW